jgi:hypothetical protein
MTPWIKKIHMYTGLLTFTALVVFGIAGVTATIQPERPQTGPVETREYQVPANLTDFEAATAVYQFLQLPLSQPPGRGAVRRDAQNHVGFTVYSGNGPRIVTLLESERQVRIELRRNNIWHFFENIHGLTPREAMADPRERLWSWYTEFAIWALIFMSVSGVWLWLASRPGYRWAQLSFAAGSGAFLLLYALTR